MGGRRSVEEDEKINRLKRNNRIGICVSCLNELF